MKAKRAIFVSEAARQAATQGRKQAYRPSSNVVSPKPEHKTKEK